MWVKGFTQRIYLASALRITPRKYIERKVPLLPDDIELGTIMLWLLSPTFAEESNTCDAEDEYITILIRPFPEMLPTMLHSTVNELPACTVVVVAGDDTSVAHKATVIRTLDNPQTHVGVANISAPGSSVEERGGGNKKLNKNAIPFVNIGVIVRVCTKVSSNNITKRITLSNRPTAHQCHQQCIQQNHDHRWYTEHNSSVLFLFATSVSEETISLQFIDVWFTFSDLVVKKKTLRTQRELARRMRTTRGRKQCCSKDRTFDQLVGFVVGGGCFYNVFTST